MGPEQFAGSPGAARLDGFVRRHFNLIVFVGLTLLTVVLYWPALTAYFVSDDYGLIRLLVFNLAPILDGRMWKEWFLGSGDGYVFFRPVAYVFYLLDYVAWNLNPFGYHLTSVILQSLSAFLVYVTSWRLMRDRLVALGAAGLFAVMPVHAAAVSWFAATTDVVCGFFYLASFLFFVLYRQDGRLRNLVVSLATFLLALMAKEVAILVPASLLAYEFFFYYKDAKNIRHWIPRHLPFWIFLGAYFWFRVSILGTFGYRGMQLSTQDVQNWINGAWINTLDPFFADWSQESRWIIAGLFLLVWLASRSRNAILFGIAWIPLISLATINSVSGWSDRSFYVATFGLSLALAALLVQPVWRAGKWRMVGSVLLFGLGLAYGVALFRRNQIYNQAGQVAESILSEVKELYPTLPTAARLVFIGVPDRVPDGQLVFLSGFRPALQILYRDDRLEAYKYNKFPIWLYQMDNMFFFQVEHRHVTARQDVVQALAQRARCDLASHAAIEWDFAKGIQGWEAWNQLTEPQIRDGALATESQGNDPNLGGPPFDVPAVAIGDIVITMRVRAKESQLEGSVFWTASDESEFNPGRSKSFKVFADGEYHQYRIDIADTGTLMVGDQVQQLRLDPVNGPAEISIKTVQVNTHCDALDGLQCTCAPR